ncbi:ester cyclase [Streptomyces sp. BE133]|uniref:ester cyclase n=1 Tax=Streptomyces sp. BE133 TaxID=3002523 RepID=UPI002E78A56A|nr:ester cyclase [Streptomyces sp. BE133]MEE1805418.1 ester cyclase [Streptomyces sp. BE133]
MTTCAEKNMALLHTAYRSLESGGLAACAALLTEDFIANVPGIPDPLHGREVWRLGAEAMLTAFPDLKIDVLDMFGVGDKVTVLVHFQGTHQGAFQQFEATGRRVEFRSIEVYRIDGDKIAEEWVAPDMLGLMQQISPDPTAH